MDDFGLKYVGQEHAQHLMNTLKQEYKISQDWEEKQYPGLDLDWDYSQRRVHISMLEYITNTLKRLHHTAPKKPQYQPHPHAKPKYGAKVQYTDDTDDYPLLNKHDKKFIHEVVGTLLYYARAVDCTMLTALGSIAVQQTAPTQSTMVKVIFFRLRRNSPQRNCNIQRQRHGIGGA